MLGSRLAAMSGQGVRRLVLSGSLLAVCCSLPDYAFIQADEATCDDQTQNGSETDTDCGGSCGPCDNGRFCRIDADCSIGSCVERTCQASHCVDHELGGGETDVDCGGTECRRCGVHQRCELDADCTSNSCMGGECVATGCDDGVVGSDETDLDCGGGTCPACGVGSRCELGGDCKLGVCLEGICSTVECGNAMLDAGEEGTDCGGNCPKACDAANDCSNDATTEVETDVDCGGGTCPRCENGRRCLVDADCTSDRCLDEICSEPCPADGCGQGGTSAGGAGAGGVMGGTGGAGSGGAGSGGDGMAGGGSPANGGTAQGGGGGVGGETAGAAGSGGVSSAGAGMGGAGGAPAAGTGGMEVAPEPTCAGCARLEVPLAAAGDKANYVINLASTQNFGSAVVRYRIYRQAGSGGQIKGYVQHGGSPDFAQFFQSPYVELAALDGWQTLSWDVGAQAGDYDKSIVARVGIQIIGTGGTSFTNPTVVYVDWIEVTGSASGLFRFEAESSVATTPTTLASSGILFCNSGDSPAAGSALGWYFQE